jgi:polysaccharide biosynthesis transport protein
MLPQSGANNPEKSVNSLAPLRQRQWLLAGSLGLMLAAAAGIGAYFYVPAPTHTARTLLHVPPQRGIVFKRGGVDGDLQNHQRTQVAMLRSRLVLNSALRDPKVAKLSIVQEQTEPVEWLEKEVEGDFSVAPEILRISMKGDKPEQLVVLVDAIAQAYRREIVDSEKNQRRERLNTLRGLREKYEEQLRDQQRMQTEIEQNAGGRDAHARALVLSFERQNLAMNERQLLETQSKLREARTELELQEKHTKAPETTIPVALMEEQIDNFPTVVKLLAEAEQHKESMRKMRQSFNNPEQHPRYQDDLRKLREVEVALAAERKRLRPGIVRHLQQKMYGQTVDSGCILFVVIIVLGTGQQKMHGQTVDSTSTLRARIASLEGMEKFYRSEVERLRRVVVILSQNESKLDAFRDDIRHIDNLTQRLINEEQALNVELEFPSEFKVVEEAQVLHGEPKFPKAMMVAGSAAAAFAVPLLAIAFWHCCLRNLVHFLGRTGRTDRPSQTPAT